MFIQLNIGEATITPTKDDILGSQKLVIDIFRGFRDELMESYGSIAHQSKSDESPITQLDIKIEKLLKKRLLEKFPSFGFKGEETEEVISTNGATWYVDPVDSTVSFIHGLPYCSNMAGLVIDGKIVSSVIYHFASNEMFTALKGQGAYKNGVQIHVNNTTLQNSYIFSDAYSYINAYPTFEPFKIKLYAPMGATGYFMTRLSQGSIQGVLYLRAGIKPHDVAPGSLIATEAGAVALSLENEPFSYNSKRFLMCTDAVYNAISPIRQQLSKS